MYSMFLKSQLACSIEDASPAPSLNEIANRDIADAARNLRGALPPSPIYNQLQGRRCGGWKALRRGREWWKRTRRPASRVKDLVRLSTPNCKWRERIGKGSMGEMWYGVIRLEL